MADISGDSKIDQGYIDGRDPKVSGPSPEKTYLGEWTTSRRELWCFYLYYVVRFSLPYFQPVSSCRPKGNNGLSGFNFGPSQFQNLLYLAGYDPSQPPFTKPCGSGTDCVLSYLGHTRNGQSFSFIRPHRPRSHCSRMDRLSLYFLRYVQSIRLFSSQTGLALPFRQFCC